MKINTPTTLLTAAATVATAGAVGLITAPISAAEDVTTTTVGSQAKLVDGNVIQGWTISDLRPSSDAIPYPVAGTLWEATATDEALQGSATPIVSNLNARARSGETYRVLFGVATPQGVNPATIAQGQKTTGKVYFDVTGDAPDAVVYSAGDQDLLAWAQAAPTPRQPGRDPVDATGTQPSVTCPSRHPGDTGARGRSRGSRNHPCSRGSRRHTRTRCSGSAAACVRGSRTGSAASGWQPGHTASRRQPGHAATRRLPGHADARR